MNKKYDFNDISIIPAVMSDIFSRKDINIFYDDKLPLFVAPMDTVVDEDNYGHFSREKLNVCIPRGCDLNKDYGDSFISISLNQAENFDEKVFKYDRILIDVANGHSKRVYNISKKIKEKYPNKQLMVGNIANPETYKLYAEIGVDFIRAGIGGGSACTTAANSSIHYPMASLIKECAEIKDVNGYQTKIVADGGFRNYDDIIKGLALGADYIMLGGIFSKCTEACGENYIYDKKLDEYIKIGISQVEDLLSRKEKVYKKFRGMSTKEVQIKWGKKKLTTSEGIIKYNPIEYKLSGWLENFSDYLRSAMSYTNCKDIKDFIGNVDFKFITENALKRFKK